jgi:hypothetical protein
MTLQAISDLENLLSAKPGSAFDAIPDAVIDPGGLVFPLEINGETLTFDCCVIG